MVGTWSAQGGRYICALRYPRYVPGACMGRSLGAATIEPRVWDHVKRLLSDPEVLRRQYAQGHGDPAVDVRAEQERERLERKLAALDREVTRLVDAYQAEVIELAELAERRRRIETMGGCYGSGSGRSRNNGPTGPRNCGCSKGSTPFVPVSGGPWKRRLLRYSKR
jgi:hypothetical protein